jgi:4-amino-4-deoxy-L-arabinose transferase-like glycosyltransferase
MSAPTITAAAPRARAAGDTRREALAVALITLVALGLRVTSLTRSIFADEAYSLALAQRSFGHMVELFGYEANGMPYPIVLWPAIRIFGTSEALLRLPAVLAGVGSVPALWWAARRMAGARVALVAAALLALTPMAVFYSQVARPYSFVVLAGCLAFGALAGVLRREQAGARSWAGYVAAMVLLAYCDIFAAPIVVPAQAVMAWRAGRGRFRHWLAALVAAAVACVPLLVAVVIARGRRDALYWLPKPGRTLFSITTKEFTAGFSGVGAARWLTIFAGGALVLGALAIAWRRRERDERATMVVALCWGLVAPLLLLVASFAKPVFWPRYAIVALPGLCLAVALAADWLWRERNRALALGAAALLALLGAVALVADIKQRTYVQEEWPLPASVLSAQRQAGEPLVIDNMLVLPALGYYDHSLAAANGDVIVQEWGDEPLPAGLIGFKDPGGYGKVPNGPPPVSSVTQAARQGNGAFWMLVAEADKDLQGDPRSGAAVAWARSHCQVQTRESIGVWLLHASGCRG